MLATHKQLTSPADKALTGRALEHIEDLANWFAYGQACRLKGHSMKRSEYDALQVLVGCNEPIKMTELASKMNRNASRATLAAEALKKRGWAETPSGVGTVDGRQKLVASTKSGVAEYRKMRTALAEMIWSVFASQHQEDQERIASALGDLNAWTREQLSLGLKKSRRR